MFEVSSTIDVIAAWACPALRWNTGFSLRIAAYKVGFNRQSSRRSVMATDGRLKPELQHGGYRVNGCRWASLFSLAFSFGFSAR